MIKHKQLRLRSIVPIFAAGIFVFLLYIYFLVPFNDLVQTFQQVNPFYLFLALAVLFLAHGFYAFTWQKLLEMLSVKTSFLKAFQFTWVANFVDILVPAESVSGDFLRIYLLSKEKSGDAGKIAASVLCHRLLVTLISVLGLLISTMYFMLYNNPPTLVLEIVATIATLNAAVFGLVIYIGAKKEAAEKIVNWTINVLVNVTRGRWKFEHQKELAVKTMNKFYEGITVFRQTPKGFIVPVFSSIIAVALDILIMALAFLSIGPIENMISLSALIIVYSSSAIIHYIPIVSGELGTMEIFLTTMFTLLGTQQTIAIYTAATVLIRILTLWVRLFVGGIIVQMMGIKSLTTKTT